MMTHSAASAAMDMAEPAAGGPAEVALDRNLLLANGIFGLEDADRRARSFILLRSQIMSGFYADGGRVLAVTSTQAGNGKSFVAANLACALSLIHPTVLIDLDLRRPTIGERFGLTVKTGVDDYLSERCEWPDVGQKVAGLNLKLYPVRARCLQSSSLLASDRLAGAMQAVRAAPDQPICIIDTPPALILDDIMLISRHAAGIMLVLEEGRTTERDVIEVRRLLSSTRVIGAVLNRSMTGQHTGYDYGYYDVGR
ncbi:Mrp family chromosome partitioning ATPase [Novosphingobium sp. SG751A]|nr:Mrp family chromosome partitioning ATPase [Novosphingobium sp. SG751A]